MLRKRHIVLALLLASLAMLLSGVHSEPAKARTIAKEPAYKQAAHQYMLLLLGQKPTREIWIVRDGSDVYVDRNGNGDLTEPGEKVVQPDTDQSASYVTLGMIEDAHGQLHGPLGCRIPTRGDRFGQVRLPIAKKYEQEANLVPLGSTPATAGVLHFDGPLTSSFLGYRDSRRVPTEDPKHLELSRSKPRLISAWVGTQLKDSSAVCCVTFSVTNEKVELQPLLTIVYENRNPKGDAIVEMHRLQEETRCHFSERIKAPANAGAKARLILTFTNPADIPLYEIQVNVVD